MLFIFLYPKLSVLLLSMRTTVIRTSKGTIPGTKDVPGIKTSLSQQCSTYTHIHTPTPQHRSVESRSQSKESSPYLTLYPDSYLI